ncbi:MAG: PQQ-dependent sugar dehydrogenase [Halioglobus sp.]
MLILSRAQSAILVMVLPALLFACSGTANESTVPPDLGDVTMVTLVEELDDPWGMDFLPGGDLLVTEKTGRLNRIDGKTWASAPVSGLPEIAQKAGQGGLLDVLVHPDFANTRWVYFSYAIADGETYTTRVSRGRLEGNSLSDVETLFTAEPFFKTRRHFGSRLLLDDGYLYITVGDRANRDLAQSLATHNGKVMRLREDGAIPQDNPFVDNAEARPEIWTYGHRNPQGMAKHPVDGSIWIAEHGPQGGDEINVLSRGNNYGWPLVTYGEEYGGGKIGQGKALDGTVQPIKYWVPSIGTGGIEFYTGDAYSRWQPSLLVAGLKLTHISRLELAGDGVGKEYLLLDERKLRIRDVQFGPDGKLYALAGGDRLIRLDPAH